ncbi:MAG: oligopeptide transport system permease protein [Thermomicrobiales bacterium]|jgi:oligopeptide transport system permease protein|nr:oligopeptide transport system permease protein [Thermomicrobiales bacterium]
MTDYLIRRVLWIIPVIVTVAAVTFFLMYRAPGGPWSQEKPLPASTVRRLDAKFGLDKPLWINPEAIDRKWEDGTRNPLRLGRAFLDTQFFNYMFGVFQGNLGPSYASKGSENVEEVIARKFPVSAKIGLVGIVFAIVVGVPLGIISSLRQNTWVDYLSLFTSTVGVSVPTFVTGLLLLIFLSQNLDVSPVRKPHEWDGFGPAYIVPGIVLGLGTMAFVTRLTRASMLEIKRQDYIRTARAKGVAEGRLVSRHMLRNALIPVITILGPAAADLVTGSIIIESIFGAPGLGREFVESISKRDYSMIMGTTIFYAVLVAVANVMVDLSYGVIDPRIRVRR